MNKNHKKTTILLSYYFKRTKKITHFYFKIALLFYIPQILYP